MTQHVAHRTSDEIAQLRRELAEAESRIKEGIQFRIAREEDNTLLARELVSTRSQLAALQAEAARVVGPFAALAEVFDEETMKPGISMEIHVPNEALRAARAFIASLPSPAVVGTFQARVHDWIIACFGEEIGRDQVERNHRFLEESLELVQSLGCTASEAHQLVDYVFGREVGEPTLEVGGVEVTLAALCTAAGIDKAAAGETELARVWTKVEKIRAKQAAKPKHSPLPMAVAPAVVAVPIEPGEGDIEAMARASAACDDATWMAAHATVGMSNRLRSAERAYRALVNRHGG